MKETIQEIAHQIFFEICEEKPMNFDLFFIDQMSFPKIDYEPRMTVYFPMQRQVQGMQVIQGNAFIDTEITEETIFTLFFAAV